MAKKRGFFVFVGFFLAIFLFTINVEAPTRTIGSYVISYNLIDYTPTCLVDCYIRFNFSLNKDYVIDDLGKFKARFVKNVGALDLADWGFRILMEEDYATTVPNCTSSCVSYYTPNGTSDKNCTSWCYPYNMESTRHVWKPFNPLGKTIQGGKWYTIELWGRKQPKLGGNSIDAIPQMFGNDFSEWAWWNSNWINRKNITITADTLTHINDFFYANVTGLTLATNNCTKELRLIDTDTNLESDFIIIDDSGQALGDGNEWCVIGFNATVTEKVNKIMSVYYNYAAATKASYVDEELGIPNFAGMYDLPDEYGWTHGGSGATWTNITVPEEGNRWHLKVTGPIDDGDWYQLSTVVNQTWVIRFNTSNTVNNDLALTVGSASYREYFRPKATNITFEMAGVTYGIVGSELQTYRFTYNNTNQNASVYVYNQSDSSWVTIGSITASAGDVGAYYFGDLSSVGKTAPNTYIDFMSVNTKGAYPPLNIALSSEESGLVESAPQWSNQNASLGSPQTYNISAKYNFQIDWTTPDNVTFESDFDGVMKNYTVSNTSTTTYWVNFTQSGMTTATHSYRWYAYNLTGGNKSQSWSYVINKNTTTIHIAINGTEAASSYGYSNVTNATAWAEVIGGTVNLYRNGTLVSNPEIVRLGAKHYNYSANITNENTTGSLENRYLMINKSDASLSLVASPSWSIYQTTQITITAGGTAPYSLYKDGVNVSSPYVAILSFNIYNFTVALNDMENYTVSSTTKWLTVSSLGYGCTNRNIYAFSKEITGNGLVTLNFTGLYEESHVKADLSDVYINTTEMEAWRNQTGNNYYFIVNATNVTSFTIRFGNYVGNQSWANTTNDTEVMHNFTSMGEYSEINPYYMFTFLEEATNMQQLPPSANRTLLIYCENGQSSFALNHSKILVVSTEQLEQIKAIISYSVTEIYYRTLIIRSNIEYKNVYLVDANENQVVQMLLTLMDSTGNFGDSILKVKKSFEGSLETITENYFDAENKVIIYLINGDRYSIYVDNGIEERSIGNFYVDSVDLTKTLTISNIYDTNLTAIGNITYHLYRRNATGYNDAIIFNYRDYASQTNNVTMWVYNYSNTSQPPLYITSSLNRSSVYFIYPVPDVNGTYRVKIHINHTQFGEESFPIESVFGVILGFAAIPSILPEIFPVNYVQALGFILIMGVPMMFTPITASTAGVFVVLIAALIVLWNWYPINIVIVVFSLALAVFNHMRSRR